MKKKLKIVGISILILLVVLIASPFIFQKQIKNLVRNYINNNVNAKVEFNDVNLSFLSSFPQANVTIDQLSITTFEPFKNDTLANVKQLSLDMSVKELFKTASEDPIIVNSINIDNAFINLKTNKDGQVNWDIAKANTNNTPSNASNNNSFVFDIENYSINNSAFNYVDESANTLIKVTNINHTGNGTFSGDTSELDTKTEANVTFSLDSTEYLSNNLIKLDALIDLDIPNQTYTFKDNQGFVNDLPLQFKGYVKQLENGQDIDISFENPGSSFKEFLAVIPKTYAKNLDNVNTTGNFKVNGIIKGKVTEETIPTLDINILSNNASFKFADLPKRVENISINAQIKNETGLVDDTFLNLNTLNFKIDEDVFKSSATIKNLTSNMLVNANIDGVLNLANITKAYPIQLENELKGILKAKLNTSFDMNAIETNAYNRIKNNGNLSVSDFVFSSADIVNPINISNANISFNPGTISLDNFNATTGQSDINAKGTINNLLGFLLSDQKLKGNFIVNSNTFIVSDFMIEGGSEAPVNQSAEPDTALKIPAFLDCNITANANTVVYDNLTLKNVKGNLTIAEEKAQLNNVTSSIFDGNLSLNGLVDTSKEKATFNMQLGASNFNISQSFNGLDMLQALAPLAKALEGKLNSSIDLSGTLGEDFTPILNTISGDAFAELLTGEFKPKNEQLVSLLENKLSFLDFSKLNLKDLKTKLSFNNGQVNVKPFDIKYKDIKMTIGGSHSFSNTMNYQVVLDVPAKYLGTDVNNLIAKINDPTVNTITIPVTANVSGSTTQPQVQTDLTSGVKNLTQQLIEIQKQKLLNTGKDKINDAINNIIKGNTTTKDSTNTTKNNTVKDVLGGILGNSNTTKDSTKTDSSNTKNPVKDVLGGIFGKKKKSN
ncbi:Outer membrane protein [Mesoflavibacter sp. HG96]|uniref:AsmA family protein n=1 Tax=Mesoflavibacter TaxID=444051 RepID=UPI000D112336|nr:MULTISPECIES: AsmA-like C-terminal region-containing protein [Mesoflavibacter]QIJ89299.1 Outer membrane protein [Mesoflavibacter sp. HG96]QIJ92027.1 Outer membrane protein [Mesoflavibacter sp. HG37]